VIHDKAGYATLYGTYALAPLLGAMCLLVAGRAFNIPLPAESKKVNACNEPQFSDGGA
jgi:hypothetical protein